MVISRITAIAGEKLEAGDYVFLHKSGLVLKYKPNIPSSVRQVCEFICDVFNPRLEGKDGHSDWPKTPEEVYRNSTKGDLSLLYDLFDSAAQFASPWPHNGTRLDI